MEFLTKNIETPKEKREQAKKIHDMVSAINSRDPTQDELIELCKICGKTYPKPYEMLHLSIQQIVFNSFVPTIHGDDFLNSLKEDVKSGFEAVMETEKKYTLLKSRENSRMSGIKSRQNHKTRRY